MPDHPTLRTAEIELQAGLSNQRNVPSLQILEGMEEIQHRATPAGELSDEDDIDL